MNRRDPLRGVWRALQARVSSRHTPGTLVDMLALSAGLDSPMRNAVHCLTRACLTFATCGCLLACGGKHSDEAREPATSDFWEENAEARLDELEPAEVMAACSALEEELEYGAKFCQFGAVFFASSTNSDDVAFQVACAEHEQTCLEEEVFDVSLCFDTNTLSPDCEAVVGDFRECLTQNAEALQGYGTCSSTLAEIDSDSLPLVPACERLLLCQE